MKIKNNIEQLIIEKRIDLFTPSSILISECLVNDLEKTRNEDIIKAIVKYSVGNITLDFGSYGAWETDYVRKSGVFYTASKPFVYGRNFIEVLDKAFMYKDTLDSKDVQVNNIFDSLVTLSRIHFEAKFNKLTVYEYLVLVAMLNYIFKNKRKMLNLLLQNNMLDKEVVEKWIGKKLQLRFKKK